MCPEGELRRTVARLNHTRIGGFSDVLVVLVPGDRIQGEVSVLVLHLERAGVIRINLTNLTMSPLRFARGHALSAAKGLARGLRDPSLRSG